MGPGTARNTEEHQGIPLTQSYVGDVFTTGIMSDWEMSMIEDNLATQRHPSLVCAWIESSTHDQEENN